MTRMPLPFGGGLRVKFLVLSALTALLIFSFESYSQSAVRRPVHDEALDDSNNDKEPNPTALNLEATKYYVESADFAWKYRDLILRGLNREDVEPKLTEVETGFRKQYGWLFGAPRPQRQVRTQKQQRDQRRKRVREDWRDQDQQREAEEAARKRNEFHDPEAFKQSLLEVFDTVKEIRSLIRLVNEAQDPATFHQHLVRLMEVSGRYIYLNLESFISWELVYDGPKIPFYSCSSLVRGAEPHE